MLGDDPETGSTVLVLDGRFGPFVQLGELDDGRRRSRRPRRCSSSMSLDTITFEDALKLLRLPRVVGADAEGHEITAQNGRYGPYLKKGTDSRSLETEDQIFTVTLARGRGALRPAEAAPAADAKPPIAELGEHPDTGAPVRVLDGRFGPYVTDGTMNATVPRGADPKSVNLEEAVELLREREARGPAKRARKTTKKKAHEAATKKKAGGTKKKAAAPRRRPPEPASAVAATASAPRSHRPPRARSWPRWRRPPSRRTTERPQGRARRT